MPTTVPPRRPDARRPDPAADIAAWTDIEFADHHTAEELACIQAAIRNADDTTAATAAGHTDAVTGRVTRRDATWCRIARHSYEFLRDTDAYSHLAAVPAAEHGTRCTADPAAIRSWLATPIPSSNDTGQNQSTRAEVWGFDDYFTLDDTDLNPHLANLFEQAQQAKVFGVAGRHVELWHVADNDGSLDGHLIVLRGPDETGLATHHIPADHLVDSDLHGIDAAVGALANAAEYINELLYNAARTGPNPHGQPHDAQSLAAASYPATSNPEPGLSTPAGAAHPRVRGGIRRRSI